MSSDSNGKTRYITSDIVTNRLTFDELITPNDGVTVRLTVADMLFPHEEEFEFCLTLSNPTGKSTDLHMTPFFKWDDMPSVTEDPERLRVFTEKVGEKGIFRRADTIMEAYFDTVLPIFLNSVVFRVELGDGGDDDSDEVQINIFRPNTHGNGFSVKMSLEEAQKFFKIA
jgi:hypothetical protein